MIRKFYDANAGGGASSKYEFGEELSMAEVQAQPDDGAEDDNTVGQGDKGKEEVKVDAKPEVKAEVKEEQKEEKKEVKEETKEAVVIPDWKEIVKKQNKKDVLSLLEIDEDALNFSNEIKQDEFVKKLVTYRKENGNVTPFIEAATKDWDKISHLDLLRDDLRRQYPTLTQEKFNILAKNRIDKRFILDDNTPEEEAELAAVELETEGEKIRSARKTEQQQFLDSVKPADKTAEAQKLAEQRQQQEQNEKALFQTMIDANPSFIALNASQKISLGSKDHSFNFPANPGSIKDQAVNSGKFFESFWKDDGNGKEVFDVEKWSRVITYATDPLAFEDALINHGKSMGTKEISENELENKTEKTDQKVTNTKKSLGKAVVETSQPISFEEVAGY